MADLWKCPGCGQPLRNDEPSCKICRITRDNRGVIGKTSVRRTIEKPPEAVEVHLPYVIKDVSYNLARTDGTSVWSSGSLVATEAGLFLLGAKDGITPDQAAAARPRKMSALGPASIFLPPSAIGRIVHERLIGYWIELPDRKIPLRLPKEAWEELDVLCDHFGIRHT
jgi:hypothetical protein